MTNDQAPTRALRAGLIGAHISRTRLPDALKIMCDKHGIAFKFSLIDTAHIEGFDFFRTVDGLRGENWTGVTITHPYKTDAAEYANEGMAPTVAGLDAANMLMFGEAGDPDKVVGHNTDYTGFLSAWRARMGNTEPGRVAMAGAGGVAHALAQALARLGAKEITIWDNDLDRAISLAAKVKGAQAVPKTAAGSAIARADGLVNATPLGMVEYPGSAFPVEKLGSQSWAFDAVYTPSETEFLKAADGAGLRCFSGFDLFRHMAIRSFEAYTGVTVNALDLVEELKSLRP